MEDPKLVAYLTKKTLNVGLVFDWDVPEMTVYLADRSPKDVQKFTKATQTTLQPTGLGAFLVCIGLAEANTPGEIQAQIKAAEAVQLARQEEQERLTKDINYKPQPLPSTFLHFTKAENQF